MDAEPTQWEKIFRREGLVFPEPRPQVMRFTQLLLDHGLGTVLDLGCGTGRHVLHMAGRGLHVSGLDNAPTALKLTKHWLDEQDLTADLILSDMRQPLPFEEDSFDALLSVQVIHHALLATVLGTAREIGRIVRQHGLILISVPTRKAISEDSPEHAEIEPNTFVPTCGTEMGLPHHLFTPDELRDAFPNFKVLDLQVLDDRVMVLKAIQN